MISIQEQKKKAAYCYCNKGKINSGDNTIIILYFGETNNIFAGCHRCNIIEILIINI